MFITSLFDASFAWKVSAFLIGAIAGLFLYTEGCKYLVFVVSRENNLLLAIACAVVANLIRYAMLAGLGL